MKFDATLLSLLLSLVVALSGWIARWRDKLKHEKQQANLERQQAIHQAEAAAEKAVIQQRDFNHLVRNQEQISNGISLGFKDLEDQIKNLDNQLRKIEAYLIRYGVISDTEILCKRDD